MKWAQIDVDSDKRQVLNSAKGGPSGGKSLTAMRSSNTRVMRRPCLAGQGGAAAEGSVT